MAVKQLATKIDSEVKDALDQVCEERGLKINWLVQEAILDKLEELMDLDDLKKLRKERFRPVEDLLEDLKKSGKI